MHLLRLQGRANGTGIGRCGQDDRMLREAGVLERAEIASHAAESERQELAGIERKMK